MKKINSNFYYVGSTILILFFVTISCVKDELNNEDTTNPYLISYNPVSGVGGVDLSGNLVLTFDDIVEKGEGKITITTDVESATQIIDINDASVTISGVGRIVTIDAQDFLPGRDYEVVLDAGIVVDRAGNKYFGMPDNERWLFKSGGNAGDILAPEVVELSPSDNNTGSSIISLKLTFNESVKVATGNIIVYNSSDVAVLTIDALGRFVSVKETMVAITLPTSLDFGKNYYVKMEPGVIKDLAGNNFLGFTEKTSWNFTTTAGSATSLVVHLPFDSDMSDISGNKFDASLGSTAIANVVFVTDPIRGKVIQFLAGSYAQLPKHNLLRSVDVTDNFSINLWVKLAGTDSDPVIIGNKSWNSGGNPGWLLSTDNGQEYKPGNGTSHGWLVNIADNPKGGNRIDWRAAEMSPQAPALSNDVWHMVSMVFDRTNAALSIYIDGIKYSNSTLAASSNLGSVAGPLYDVTNDYPITLWEDGTGLYNAADSRRAAMTGLMDDLRIYNKVLTPNEITNLFSN